MAERLRRVLPPLIGLVLFVGALEVLRRELQTVTWHTLSADVMATSRRSLAAAILLTALNYAALTGYDFVAFASIGKRLPARRIAWASFLAYAIANNVGFAALSGASVRYRFYSRWGLTAEDLSRLVFSYSVAFWLGLLLLGGVSLAFNAVPAAGALPGSGVVRALGWALIGLSVAYLIAVAVRREPLRVRGFMVPLPSVPLAFAQLLVSVIDWMLAGAVLFVLLPSQIPFVTVLGAFLAAQILGLASHVPGGVGVFEGVLVLLLAPFLSSSQLVPSLVVYRAVYYLTPLAAGLVGLVVDEVQLRRTHATKLTAYVGRMTERLTPQVLAVFTFIAGVMLLFSGATPAEATRLMLLDRLLPLGVIEASHVTGSVAGAVLLLLSQGLARRLDAAYYLTMATLAAGTMASLLKGMDYEEAILLLLLFAVLRQARPAFDRRAALLATRFSPAWMAAVTAALAASIWLGFFAFKHVEYSSALWWQFELDGGASRFLRASVGASTVVLLFAVARLIGYAPHEIDAPSDADLDDAGRIIATQSSTVPYLVYLRDKAILFDERRQAFLTYGIQGRTWVALGDPVGASPARVTELVRLFIERCDDFGGTPVFYEAGTQFLHCYADFGLTFVKMGEEARVDLERLSLDGPRGARFRRQVRQLEKESALFHVLPAQEVPARMSELREVSDDWLRQKATAEKGFSLGFFTPDYVARFPVAVIERGGRIEAFATVWPGPGRVELSVDLMRYCRRAPGSVMEMLFAHLAIWGQGEGYRWLSLGMAPMSGFERSPIAPLWTRAGSFLYEHGSSLYNFQGLRAFKEKFDPVWESRYLVYPGGLALLRIAADVSALVSGGYRRILSK